MTDPAPWPAYRLRVDGDVERPLTFGYDDLVALSDSSLTASFLCGSGERWGGTWHGVAVRTLLDAADPSPATTHLTVEGRGDYAACLPVADALDGVVALRREEGGPLGDSVPTRLVVPGIAAARTVRDVRRIVAETLGPGDDPEARERRVTESPRAAEWEEGTVREGGGRGP